MYCVITLLALMVGVHLLSMWFLKVLLSVLISLPHFLNSLLDSSEPH